MGLFCNYEEKRVKSLKKKGRSKNQNNEEEEKQGIRKMEKERRRRRREEERREEEERSGEFEEVKMIGEFVEMKRNEGKFEFNHLKALMEGGKNWSYSAARSAASHSPFQTTC